MAAASTGPDQRIRYPSDEDHIALYCPAVGALRQCRERGILSLPEYQSTGMGRRLLATYPSISGERRESFFYNGLLYEQVLAGLGGPPDPILDVGNGSRFASACRAHSCTEKAAVVIACPDEVLAVGILHFNIGLQRFNAMHATLTIYSDRLDGQVRSAFENWRRHVAEVDAIDIATDYRHLLRPTPQPPETHRRLSKQITK